MRTIFTILKDTRINIGVEIYALVISLYISLVLNQNLWSKIIDLQADKPILDGALFSLAVFVLLTSLNYWLISIFSWRWGQKIISLIVVMITAGAGYFSARYNVYFDTTMMANILTTDVAESRELMTAQTIVVVLIYSIPIFIFSYFTKLKSYRGHRYFQYKFFGLLISLVICAAILIPQFRGFSSVMRNNHDLRHFAVPISMAVSGVRQAVVLKNVKPENLAVIGEDASRATADDVDEVVVLVVGETVRAANWGLSAYARDTTPELSRKNIINFPYATSCGTNTDTSVPCIFSVYGRENYDERKIKSTQNLLHILNRVGFEITWIDNQSGCKGVCNGFNFIDAKKYSKPNECRDGHCYDSNLIPALNSVLDSQKRKQFIVLHPLGNHGPAYFKRYPDTFSIYEPACKNANLDQCDRASLVNAYDNSIRYTDYLLANIIDQLARHKDKRTSLIYVSDHGESLGEKGIYLHGIPYAIAPKEQIQVPLFFWFSDAFKSNAAERVNCLKTRAKQPAHHDDLFHTVLGLLKIQTAIKNDKRDLSLSCNG